MTIMVMRMIQIRMKLLYAIWKKIVEMMGPSIDTLCDSVLHFIMIRLLGTILVKSKKILFVWFKTQAL